MMKIALYAEEDFAHGGLRNVVKVAKRKGRKNCMENFLLENLVGIVPSQCTA